MNTARVICLQLIVFSIFSLAFNFMFTPLCTSELKQKSSICCLLCDSAVVSTTTSPAVLHVHACSQILKIPEKCTQQHKIGGDTQVNKGT